MRKINHLLALAFALFAGNLVAADRPYEYFVADARGQIEIGPDGTVLDAELSSDLGEVKKDVLAQIRQWRFEPIIEEGRPVIAIAQLRVKLIAATERASKQTRLGFLDVRFADPPKMEREARREHLRRMTPPRYPVDALRDNVGADLQLLLEVDEQGKVINAGVEQALLTFAGSPSQRSAERHLKRISAAAIESARQWQIPMADGAGRVRVPVSFQFGNGAWRRALPMEVSREPWMVLDKEARVSVIDEAGDLASNRFRLTTELPAAL